MSFKCIFKLEEVNKQPASMNITMTMEEWTHLADHLRQNPHWVGNELAAAICHLLNQAREHLTAEGKSNGQT